MSISKSVSVVEQQLPRFVPYFILTRGLRPELAAFATPDDVVAALHPSSAMSATGRYALTAALVAEHQERPHALWLALLLISFAPMLNVLRAKISRLPDEDADQRVILAFMEAVGDTEPDEHVAIALRRATARTLFAPTEDELEVELVSFLDEEHSPADPFAVTEVELRVDAAWSAKRAAHLHGAPRLAPVRKLPRRRSTAA